MHIVSAFAAAVLALTQATFAPPPSLDAPARTPAVPSATILFGGDMMFDRSVRTSVEKNGGDFLFSCIDPMLEMPDLVVANLEGPITPNDSRSVGSAVGSSNNYVFTFPISTATLLAVHHVAMVNLGNNHIMNFGSAGALSTMSTLKDAGVQYFGDPLSANVATTTINGLDFAFINYNEFSPQGSSPSTTIEQIQIARMSGEIPVVYTHWGIEYRTIAPQYVRDLAHRFVDAGAAAVIGSHPHVVEDHETYRGVPIYYSLGNLIFDQYFSDDVSHGLLLLTTFTRYGVASVNEIPIELMRDRSTCLVH